MSRPPTGTYRLQLRPEFGFAEAGELAGYLAALGVSHVYLSPILQAAPGSAHGYDVVDHRHVSEELGGEEAFRAMAARFREHGLAIVIDIVPNHMAIPVPESLNDAFWDVLRDGPDSAFARWFDVDWADGRHRAARARLARRRGAARRRRPALPRPRLPGRRPLPARLLARDRAELPRFFDISTLIALRPEDQEVFDRTHALPLRFVRKGLVDGLRIDHPDGLADPRGYLRQARRARRRWVVVEKILTDDEELPADWPCAGTTGYDALGMVGGLFADPSGEKPLTEAYTRLTGGPGRLHRGRAGGEEVRRRAPAGARGAPADRAAGPRPAGRGPRGAAPGPRRAAGRDARLPHLRRPRRGAERAGPGDRRPDRRRGTRRPARRTRRSTRWCRCCWAWPGATRCATSSPYGSSRPPRR